MFYFMPGHYRKEKDIVFFLDTKPAAACSRKSFFPFSIFFRSSNSCRNAKKVNRYLSFLKPFFIKQLF